MWPAGWIDGQCLINRRCEKRGAGEWRVNYTMEICIQIWKQCGNEATGPKKRENSDEYKDMYCL